jgi:hypothetical protein
VIEPLKITIILKKTSNFSVPLNFDHSMGI